MVDGASRKIAANGHADDGGRVRAQLRQIPGVRPSNGKAGDKGSTEAKTETKAESPTAADSSGSSASDNKSDGTGTATTPKKDK